MFYQVISVVGATLILAAFGMVNSGRIPPTNLWYGVMNFVGSSLLAWVAIVDQRVGFIILEIAWAAMSLLPLLRRRNGGADAPAS